MYSGMLIGAEIEVIASRDGSMLNLKGLVVDETKNLLVVLTPGEKQIKIPKSVVTINVSSERSESRVIEGWKLVGTPAERIKG